MKNAIKKRITEWNWNFMDQDLLAVIMHAAVLILICVVVYWITRKIIVDRIHRLALKSKGQWDDKLMDAHFFKRVILLLPLFIIRYSTDAVLADYDTSIPIITKLFELIIAIAAMRIVIAFINAFQKIMEGSEAYKDKPIQSYAQIMKIAIWLFFGITAFSLITGKTPMFFLTAMGAMSAIVILIFKDTLLGFIGSIQLASNDMVRIGDWITMEKYGADGNVVEINLATIKVRNFDLTITTIPTYALISDSFKNWRGMEESGGRRIKRALNIKLSSIEFCSSEQIDKFASMRLLKDYINERQKDIQEHNKRHGLDLNSSKVNGRSLTNVGVFRKYVEFYLKNNNMVNTDLTCMVRQLAPGSEGLPIEVYAFSKDKKWVNYESIMADIFDHLIAILPQFDLEAFQNPSGSDFQLLAKS